MAIVEPSARAIAWQLDRMELEGATAADARAVCLWVDDSQPQTVRLAARFASELRAWLSADDWAEMRARNSRPPYAGPEGPCASHDFCDANEAMAEAFREIVGRDLLPDDGEGPTDADCALWNDAWHIAKREFLTA